MSPQQPTGNSCRVFDKVCGSTTSLKSPLREQGEISYVHHIRNKACNDGLRSHALSHADRREGILQRNSSHYLYIYLSRSAHLSIYLSIYLSIPICIFLSFFLSFFLSLSQFISIQLASLYWNLKYSLPFF